MKKVIQFINSAKFVLPLTFAINVGLVVVGCIYNWSITLLVSVMLSIFSLFALWIIDRGKGLSRANVLCILLLPVFGLNFYIYLGRTKGSVRLRKIWQNINFKSSATLLPNQQVIDELTNVSITQSKVSNYLVNTANMPVYQGTTTKYYSEGEQYFEAVLEELKKAERYIFVQSYIVEQGNLWDEIFSVLKVKARQGVEVKIIYDDMGGDNRFDDKNTFRKLSNYCIDVVAFNRVGIFKGSNVNYRNKRKCFVIDGKVAMISALNIGDAYVNLKQVFGAWKDSGVMISGEAAYSVAVQFLNDWQFATHKEVDLGAYRPSLVTRRKQSEWVQPFATNPFTNADLVQNIVISLISNAKNTVYIISPTLILNDALLNVLKIASKSGVDIRVVYPGVPVNRGYQRLASVNFANLLRSGVKLYEYTPGYIHSKCIIVDGEMAMLGNINLDFRSTRNHYENGVMIYGGSTVTEVKFDFERVLNSCHMVTLKDIRSRKLSDKIISKTLSFFEPIG